MKDIYTLSSRLKKLDDIHAQLMPNGGSSIKDTVDRIERKLAFNSEWIRAADRDSGRIVVHLDADGNVEWANRSFLDLFHAELSDVIGQGWLSLIDREDYNQVSEEIENSIADARDINVQFRIGNDLYTLKAHILKNKNSRFGYLGIVNKNAKS